MYIYNIIYNYVVIIIYTKHNTSQPENLAGIIFGDLASNH